MNIRYRSASTAPRRRMATDRRVYLLVLSCVVPVALLLAWAVEGSSLPVSRRL